MRARPPPGEAPSAEGTAPDWSDDCPEGSGTGTTTAKGALADSPVPESTATTWWSPPAVPAGTVASAVNAPSEPAVAVPMPTGSECRVRATEPPGVKSLPVIVTVPPAVTDAGETAIEAGAFTVAAVTVTEETFASFPNPFIG